MGRGEQELETCHENLEHLNKYRSGGGIERRRVDPRLSQVGGQRALLLFLLSILLLLLIIIAILLAGICSRSGVLLLRLMRGILSVHLRQPRHLLALESGRERKRAVIQQRVMDETQLALRLGKRDIGDKACTAKINWNPPK